MQLHRMIVAIRRARPSAYPTHRRHLGRSGANRSREGRSQSRWPRKLGHSCSLMSKRRHEQRRADASQKHPTLNPARKRVRSGLTTLAEFLAHLKARARRARTWAGLAAVILDLAGTHGPCERGRLCSDDVAIMMRRRRRPSRLPSPRNLKFDKPACSEDHVSGPSHWHSDGNFPAWSRP